LLTTKIDRTNTLDKLKKEYYQDYRNDIKFHIKNMNPKETTSDNETWGSKPYDIFNRPHMSQSYHT